MDAKKVLEALKEVVSDMATERNVVKTFKATKDEVARFQEISDLIDAKDELEAKAQAKKDLVWAQIKDRTNKYDSDFRFNPETKEIEELE